MIASLQCARSCSQSVNFAKLSPEWGAKVWLTDWVTHSKEDFMGDTIIITSLVTDFESHRTWEENHDFLSPDRADMPHSGNFDEFFTTCLKFANA